MSPMTADDIIALLLLKFTPRVLRTTVEGFSWIERQMQITDGDLEQWSERAGLPIGALCDALALNLARGFYGNTLDFNFCDHLINDLFAITARWKEGPPKLFWSIFLAFDAGEIFPNNDRSIDPVEAYTRPQIAQIIQRQPQLP